MRLAFQLSAQMACRYTVLSRCAPSAAAKRHATCARALFQLPTTGAVHAGAISAMAPVTSMLDNSSLDPRLIPYLAEIEKYRFAVPGITENDMVSPSALIDKIYNYANAYFQKHGKWESSTVKYLHSICYQISGCLMANYYVPVAVDDIKLVVLKKHGPILCQ